MKHGELGAIKDAVAKDYLDPETKCFEASELHYNMFESMITGRDMYDEAQKPTGQFKNMFPAQLIKDYSMAYCVNKLLKADTPEQRYLVIAGYGHMEHYCGVPERILKVFPEMADKSMLLIAHEADEDVDLWVEDEKVFESVKAVFGPEGAENAPADYFFVYEEDFEPADEEDEATEADKVKQETIAAYDKVGETAYLKGNLGKAKAVMTYLGYTEEEFKIAGEDAYNYQGVGNPHNLAKIQPGEKVLDLGSGLGVDSFLACHYAGPSGKVIGLDISSKEVQHATKRAESRGLNMKFVNADMESIPLPDEMLDVVISNGAFCLAPNKEKAFSEIFRVLRPGGRMAICTSAVTADLDAGVNWPVCMRMFVHQNKLEPMCRQIGFNEVKVDDSNSLMSFDLPEEQAEAQKAQSPQTEKEEQKTSESESNASMSQKSEIPPSPHRNQVHVGSKEFEHLKNYDMNKICARVVVYAKKPLV